MESKKRIKLEIELIKSFGFKKVWFGDKSGYWFIKPIKYKDLKLELYAEIDNNLLLLDVESGECYNKKIVNTQYNSVKKYSLTTDNIKMLIKRYK